jgi:putative hydrolase of the HAD superfamily
VSDLGVSYDENYHLSTYKKINDKMWSDLEKGNLAAEELKVQRFRQYMDAINISIDPVKVSDLYEKHLSEASFLYEESFPVIKELHKNFRLFIITNGLSLVQRGRLERSILLPYFEDIIISEEVKVSKPNPKIFEIALEKANFTEKKKVLMIGDSLSSDIKGGINFGIDTCWLNKKNIENNTNITPTYEIKSLYEIEKLLRL